MVKSSCFKNFVKYASLNALGMLGLSCYILADTFFVANGLGANGLTALNLAVPVYSFIHGSGLMIGMGGGIKYAVQKNRQDLKATDRVFTNAVCLAAVFSAFLVWAGVFMSGSIVTCLGADEEIFSMTQTYIRVILLFAPAFLMNNVLLCFVRNDGAPRLAMAAMVGGSLSNVILDYLFVFPLKMGMFGAAFATGLAPVVSMLILSAHFVKGQNQFHLTKCRYSGRLLAGIVSGGLPSLITEMSSGVVMIVFNRIILSLQGNTGVAAYGVIANLSLVAVALYTGIAQGIQPIISSSYGAGNIKDVRSILKYALITMLILSGLIYAGIYVGASSIAALFNSGQNELLQVMAVEGLRLYFIACPFVGFNVILTTYFASTEFARPAHMISLLRGFFLIIPMAFVLSQIAGMTGIWCAFPATEFIVMLVSAFFLYRRQKRKKLKALH